MRELSWRKLYHILKCKFACKVEYGVELRKHTSFHIGGKAKIIIFPETQEDIIKALFYLKNTAYYILGSGTNVLACDEDYEGVVIKLTNYRGITKANDLVEVLAGTLLSQLCIYYKNSSLSGVEKIFGILGTVGGAVVMNAGANGGEISDSVTGVLAYSKGKICYYPKKECKFSYRSSVFKNNFIILKIFLKFSKGNKEDIEKQMNEYINKRKSSQPLGFSSAGSVFKRKGDIIVSKMIDCKGLKGYNINDAEISKVHAGFIVNKGKATCKDVLALIDFLKKYFIRKGIELEEEICFLRNNFGG